MGINLSNFLTSKSKKKSMMEFQDLDHIDGVSISTICAKLYYNNRDDLVLKLYKLYLKEDKSDYRKAIGRILKIPSRYR